MENNTNTEAAGKMSSRSWLGRTRDTMRTYKGLLALLGSLVVFVASLSGMYLALYIFAFNCGENCPKQAKELPPSEQHWWLAQDSWQWTAQFIAACVGLVATALVVYFVFKGRYGRALTSLAVAACFWIIWGVFLGLAH